MTVEKLMDVLSKLKPTSQIAIQRNHKDGYFSLHEPILQVGGHIGFDGTVIHTGPPVEDLDSTREAGK